MAHLTTFYWGWLLGSALLGFGMGWISVVQRGEGVSPKLRWWLSALVAALIAAALARVVPGRFGYWLDLGGSAAGSAASATWEVLDQRTARDDPPVAPRLIEGRAARHVH